MKLYAKYVYRCKTCDARIVLRSSSKPDAVSLMVLFINMKQPCWKCRKDTEQQFWERTPVACKDAKDCQKCVRKEN